MMDTLIQIFRTNNSSYFRITLFRKDTLTNFYIVNNNEAVYKKLDILLSSIKFLNKIDTHVYFYYIVDAVLKIMFKKINQSKCEIWIGKRVIIFDYLNT